MTQSRQLQKFLILGATRTGKTALCRALQGNLSKPADLYVETQADPYIIRSSNLRDKASIFELGGNHAKDYLSFYAKSLSRVIFTIDPTQDISKQQQYLLHLSQQINVDIPRVLVITKSDLRPNFAAENVAVMTALKAQLRLEENDLFCSAVTGLNIGLLKNKLLPVPELAADSKENGESSQQRKEVSTLATTIFLLEASAKEDTIVNLQKRQFAIPLRNLNKKIYADLKANKLSVKDHKLIEDNAILLATRVRNNTLSLGDINIFQNQLAKFHTTWGWRVVLGAVVGAAIGVFIGTLAGIWSGPGAAIPALYCGIKGAVLGAAVGGGLGLLGGTGLGMWRTRRQNPLVQVAAAARVLAPPVM